MSSKSRSDMLSQLQPQHLSRGKEPSFSEEEGRAAISALRRGVTLRQVGEAMATENVAASLGTWAIHYCRCSK